MADHRHLVVFHEDPSRLLVSVRAPTFSLNAFVAHSPIEGSEESETWWVESQRVARLAPTKGCTLYFVDANGRLGSVLSECVGPVHPEAETLNGYFFHLWMRQLGICAFSTFRCKGSGATGRSTQNTLRRIDFVCGLSWLMGFPHDTWVATNLDVATVKDDHCPTVAELLWQPLPPCSPACRHSPLVSRASLK